MICYGGGPECEMLIRFSIENGRMSPPERLQYSCKEHLSKAVELLMSEGGGAAYEQCVRVGKWGSW